ncbi:molybdopterin-dependent oxidoreductase [Aggregatilineales bacterium SYSU G02658]
MTPTARRPSISYGLLLALLLTPVLTISFVIGGQVAGLPVVPYDLFDWVGRVLPGAVVTAGIDTIVAVVLAFGLGDDISTAAKAVEQGLAVVIFYGLTCLVSLVFYALLNRLKPPRSVIPGALLALSYGGALTIISLTVNRSATANPVVAAAWMALLFGAWGVLTYSFYQSLADYNVAADRNVRVRGLSRRQFLVRVGASSAVITLGGAALSRLLNLTQAPLVPAASADQPTEAVRMLPNADDPVIPAPGTRAEVTPVSRHYRIDISLVPPVVNGEAYRLPISGAVANPVEWTLDEIRAMPSRSDFITMACISNPIAGSLIGTTKWTGVPMQYIMAQVQPLAGATGLRIVGADGFDEYLSLRMIEQDERIMLTYAWDDAPLPIANGFPLRIHIPDLYGMKQPKWITAIEVVEEMGEGYWVRRGWSPTAIVNATSVIDTIAAEAAYQDEEGQLRVPIGGMAWAGARGISAVEVRLNGEAWQPAQVRAPLSDRTWVIWRFDWPYEEGLHTFEVRCLEGSGTPQVETFRDVRPNGATGLHRRREPVNLPVMPDGSA